MDYEQVALLPQDTVEGTAALFWAGLRYAPCCARRANGGTLRRRASAPLRPLHGIDLVLRVPALEGLGSFQGTHGQTPPHGYCMACSKVVKYATVRCKPSSSPTLGSHPRVCLASVISGWRCVGSSCGRGLKTILERAPVSFRIISATSRMVYSPGFPKFIGPMQSSGLCINAMSPSMRSST